MAIPYRRASFPLIQDDHSTKGQRALTALIRTTSRQALHHGDEEAGPFGDSYDDQPHRTDERRMSTILNGLHMRGMRLIGNSNPRYRWERYWKTEEELAQMKKPMYEASHSHRVPGDVY